MGVGGGGSKYVIASDSWNACNMYIQQKYVDSYPVNQKLITKFQMLYCNG